jgi:aryl-alcohol dehydrogenase-like predicted oxidoreductase
MATASACSGAVFAGKRKDVVLATKTTAKTRDQALLDLDASLKAFGTDYIDIWHLHGRNAPADVADGLFEAQRTAKQQGQDPLRRRQHALHHEGT